MVPGGEFKSETGDEDIVRAQAYTSVTYILPKTSTCIQFIGWWMRGSVR